MRWKLLHTLAFAALTTVLGGCMDQPMEPLSSGSEPALRSELAPLFSLTEGGQKIPDRYIRDPVE